ncbi:MAG: hypothetical protein JXA42_18365 [Anaerolineales bacterium]|nr:hypothetical protein [Anaerolineales bacterium]
MSRKYSRVRVFLDTKGITSLPDNEIAAILRGADPLIMSGGRNLLSKLLKGSRDKKVLERGLDKCPVYGFFSHLTLAEIMSRIDWMIVEGYLEIEYDWRLPLLCYSPLGWTIERNTYADELLQGFDRMLARGSGPYDMGYLKNRSRDMILLLLDKVEETRDPKYVQLLEDWAKIDYKKVRQRIRQVMRTISEKETL